LAENDTNIRHNHSFAKVCTDLLDFRNKRSVWTIATQPYSQAHFATFPEEIPKLCILAGSRVGDTILDPFAGSGTVGQVALELGRRAILIELNPAYIELAEERTNVTPGFF
jgi:site-specific DNA-methyltransferase (cytosine-N4-specific)